MNGRCRTALIIACCLAAPVASRSASRAALPDVLTESFARYQKLAAYADAGTVTKEAPGILDESKFRTAFRRATRDLYLDFQPLTSTTPQTKFSIDMTGARSVIWMIGGHMQTYDFRSRAHQVVRSEGGGQVSALQTWAHGTSGVSTLIPSLLYSQARLPSTLMEIQEAQLAGVETVDGRLCHKVTGTAWAYYPSGAQTGVRPVTVWIDVESRLIRKVFEDTPKGYPAGQFLRLTTTLQPQADPPLEPAAFEFMVPAR